MIPHWAANSDSVGTSGSRDSVLLHEADLNHQTTLVCYPGMLPWHTIHLPSPQVFSIRQNPNLTERGAMILFRETCRERPVPIYHFTRVTGYEVKKNAVLKSSSGG